MADRAAALLDALTASPRSPLPALATAWLESGASGVGVWSEGELLAGWPREAPDACAAGLVAPITANGRRLGELRVAGAAAAAPAAAGRLNAEAALLGRLAVAEGDVAGLTDALLETQDQLLALYDLGRALRSALPLDQAVPQLVAAVANLMDVETVAAIVGAGEQPALIAQYPESQEAVSLRDLLTTLLARQDEVLINADPQGDLLPPGIRNLFFVPLRSQGTICGGMALLNKLDGLFATPDLKLARAIAEQASGQIENVLLHQEAIVQAKLQGEMELAARLQLRLLPPVPPLPPGIALWSRTRPASWMGGDFYDFSALPGRPFLLAAGDVSGKGMPAALMMGMIHAVLHSAARAIARPTPTRVLSRMTADLYHDFTEVGMFATVFIGQYDPATRSLYYANAGQAPVIYCPAGGRARLLKADCPPLGVLPTSLARLHRRPVRPGDLLVVATDGFNEALDPAGHLFGETRLLDLVTQLRAEPAPAIGAALFEAIQQYAAGRAAADDQTLVVLKGVSA